MSDEPVSQSRREVSDREVTAAMWRGDQDWLDSHLRCECCCHEHFHENCPARRWYGCRGQGSLTKADVEAWVAHYAQHHGMTRAEFFLEASR